MMLVSQCDICSDIKDKWITLMKLASTASKGDDNLESSPVTQEEIVLDNLEVFTLSMYSRIPLDIDRLSENINIQKSRF
jgi:hypothetical protein